MPRKLKKHNFKAGDKVRIRRWKEMEEEFGLNDDGFIKCLGVFSTPMKKLCGLTATISIVHEDNYVGLTDWKN